MNRIQAIKYTMAHRKALNELAGRFGYSYPLHDLDKIFLYVIFGKKITGKIHRLYSKHHEHIDDSGYYHIEDKIQAAFDWECSRFTKPDKPMTAYEYWIKSCPEVDMLPTLQCFGFLPNKPFSDILMEVAEARNKRFQSIDHKVTSEIVKKILNCCLCCVNQIGVLIITLLSSKNCTKLSNIVVAIIVV